MKRLLLSFILLITVLLHADTQTTGNMKLLLPSLTQVDPTRNWADKYNANFQIIDSTMAIVQNQITGLSTTTANPPATVNGISGATMTFTFDISSVYVATNGPCAIPKACYSMGVDTGVMVGYWMDAVLPSTNTFTGFKVVTTTGASTGVVFQGIPIQDRFNNTTISLSTSVSTGRGDGFSGFVSTAIPFNSGDTFSVWCTTVSNSGTNARGVKFHFDMWFKSRY